MSGIEGGLSDIGCDTQKHGLQFPWKPVRLPNSSATIFKRQKYYIYLCPPFNEGVFVDVRFLVLIVMNEGCGD